MNKPNAIVVGTDLTSQTSDLLNQAIRLAQAYQGHVVLVHAVEPIENPDRADEDTAAFHDELMRKAELWMTEQRELWSAEVDLCTYVELGSRVKVLVGSLKERKACMLVIGSPFRDDGPPVGIGLQTLAQSPCPVLMVPFHAR